MAPHYRSTVEFTDAALEEAAVGYRRIEGFVRHAVERVGADAGAPVLCADFTAAMDDDLGTPAAIAAVHEMVREGNSALAAGDDARRRRHAGLGARDARRPRPGPARPAVGLVVARDDRLVDVTDGAGRGWRWSSAQAARARKDYAAADAIRDSLGTLGVQVEDTPQGPRWELKD